jgi:1,4-dihydroxy-2-naphthoyl-CoA hydrolase
MPGSPGLLLSGHAVVISFLTVDRIAPCPPMSIWFQTFDLALLNARSTTTLDGTLGVVYSGFGADWLAATIPVDQRTHQPYGRLHGGASAALAESLGSLGANLCVDPARYHCVGQTLTVSHLSGIREGHVVGTARPIHRGRSSQVWQIDIRKPDGVPVSLASLTVAVLTVR